MMKRLSLFNIRNDKKINLSRAGFTLIELLVAVAVIGILSTLVVINASNARYRANDSKALATVVSVQRSAAKCVNAGGNLNMRTFGENSYDKGVLTFVAGGPICSDDDAVYIDLAALKLRSKNSRYWSYSNRQLDANGVTNWFGYWRELDVDHPENHRLFYFGATASCSSSNIANCQTYGATPILGAPSIVCNNNSCQIADYATANPRDY